MNPERPLSEGQPTGTEAKETRKPLSLPEILRETAKRPDLTEADRKALEVLIPKILDTARGIANPRANVRNTRAETPPPLPSTSAPEAVPQEPAKPEEPEKTLSPEEKAEQQWLKEVRELFNDPKITAALEAMLKDPNLETAQKTLQFGRPATEGYIKNDIWHDPQLAEYALFIFNIKEYIQDGLEAINYRRKPLDEPLDKDRENALKSSIRILQTLDPLTKLYGLPPSFADKVEHSIKPFLKRYSEIMGQRKNGKVEIIYPRNKAYFDDNIMTMTGSFEERDMKDMKRLYPDVDFDVPYARVVKFDKPGLVYIDENGQSNLLLKAEVILSML